MRSTPRMWAAAAAALVLAACHSAATESGPNGTDLPAPSIAATGDIAFPRTLQSERMVEVRVQTPGHERGIVTSVAVRSPYFADSGTVSTNVLLEPGWVSRLRVPLGEARCPAPPGDSVATVEVRAYEGDQVAAHEVGLTDRVLADINATECRQRIATDAAAPSFDDQPTVVDETLETAVVLSRGGSRESATLVALTGNVIFSLEPGDGALPVTLGGGEASVSVPVSLTATRCDAHAFAESKKTFVFTATYEVAGDRITVEYLAAGATRDALQGLFDACGEANPSDGIGG